MLKQRFYAPFRRLLARGTHALAGAMLLAGGVGAEDAIAQGEGDFDYCLVCHGTDLGGNEAIGAPNLTHLPAWYLEAQLRDFKQGYRGWHPEDEHGRSMASAARELPDADAIAAAVSFVETYPAIAGTAPAGAGNAERGAVLFRSCAACHGGNGAGSELVGAPPLAGQNPWYLKKALGDYRAGRRGANPEDKVGASMRLASQQLVDDQAVVDVVAFIGTLAAAEVPSQSKQPEENPMMNKKRATALTKALPALALATASASVLAHDVTRYPLPGGSTFPIAQAVTVPAGTELTFHSGLLPRPANPDADPASREFLGDTYAQTMSVLQQFEASLREKGMGLGNIIKMNVYLVGDPELDGKMDFAGFMRAYSQFFGTEEQPHLPARAAIQIAGLARGAFIEIEVIAAR